GYPRRTVRGLLLAEGGALALAGGLVGLAGALVYAWLLLGLLGAWWPGGLEASLLHLHATWPSLALGYGLSAVVSLLTVVWAVRVWRVSVSATLLAIRPAVY